MGRHGARSEHGMVCKGSALRLCGVRGAHLIAATCYLISEHGMVCKGT